MKLTTIFLISVLSVCMFAEDFMQPAQIAKDSYNPAMRFGMKNVTRNQYPAPEYSFIPNGDGDNTTYLTSSYYDYMPFSYNGFNLRKQPENSQPYGYQAGGSYVSYMRSETQNVSTDRRAYYGYINVDGTHGESNACNSQVNREGFTSLSIDPYTGDAFMVWHAVTEPDGSYDSHMSYSLFHATGSAGAWITPFILIDNPEMSEPFTGHYDDEFIWPIVWIGPSPEAGHRRVHAYGNNCTNTNYNSLYLYADFDDIDLLTISNLEWTVSTFPYFDYIAYNDIGRINKDMIVCEDDGQVTFIGSVADSLFALYSEDYGETFTRYTQQLKQPMTNPTNNQTGDYLWYNDDGMTPSEMYILPSNDLSHFNGVFTDNNTKVQWMGGVNYNSQENIDDGEYWAAYIYPKIFTFNTVTHEFSFYDIDVQDTDPADDHLAVAFDLDDDGEVDEYDIFGWPIVRMSAPSWFYNSDNGWQDAYFHESNCKMVANGDWLVAAWYDGAKLQNSYWGEEGYDGWYQQPEIAIIISDDGGTSWSDIRYINANPNDNVIDPVNHYDGNYAPELAGMLPVYISLGDKLEILSNTPGDYHAKLNFVFMDDGDYGSAVGPTSNNGDLTNNALRYAAIDLDFGETIIPLVAEFTADITSGDPPLTVNFTDLSTGSNLTNWEWDFDNDGTIDSYDQNPTYTYSDVGMYTISLTVYDNVTVDTETKVDYITVGDPLIADFSADPLLGLLPVDIQFTDLSTGEFDIIVWEWDFDNDGTIDSYDQNPTYTYSNAGIYTISLTVYDNVSVDTETKINYIIVGSSIVADFEADPFGGLLPLNVQFTDLSTGGFDIIITEHANEFKSSLQDRNQLIGKNSSREITNWEWDFDNDGTIDSYDQNPTYTYTEAGLYTVSLTVRDGIYEAIETKVDYITVGEPIIADFEADPLFGLAPLNVQFTDLSSGGLDIILDLDKDINTPSKTNSEKKLNVDSSREIVSWEWDFDNNGTIDSYEQNPAYTYTEDGIYTVVLTVSDGFNTNTKTKMDYITVGFIPPTNLTADLDEVTGEVALNWNYGTGTGFYEDFEDGVADNWVPIGGNWLVGSGVYNVNADGTHTENSSYYDQTFNNYSLEAKMRIVNAPTSGTNIGFYLNGDPLNVSGNGEWVNSYIFCYQEDNQCWLSKFDGGWTTIMDTISSDLNTSDWNILKVIYADGYFELFINGISYGTYFDDSFTNGNIGLKTWDSTISLESEFDYVSLTGLDNGYAFDNVKQSKYRNVYSSINNPEHLIQTDALIGQDLAPTPPYKGKYTYQPDSESRDFQNFNIYRDGTVIGTTETTSYTDDLTEFGAYEYEVTAFYVEGESESAGPAYVEWLEPPDISVSPTSLSETLQVDETSTQYLTIYNNGESDLNFDITIQDVELRRDNTIGIKENSNSALRILTDELRKNHYNSLDLHPENIQYPNDDKLSDNPVMSSRCNNKQIPGSSANRDVEEVFGSTIGYSSGAQIMKGNVFYVNNPTTLVEQKVYLSIGNSTILYFMVYEGTEAMGVFTKINEIIILNSGTGEGWYSSGSIDVSMNSGMFYYIVADWSDTVTYYYGNETVPITTTFGTLESRNGNSAFPPPNQVIVDASGLSPYYQAVVTNDNTIDWLSVSLASGIVPANSSTDIELTFDATDLEPDEYSANILINSNDPDEPLVTVPVTLEVIDEVVPLISDFEADPLTGLLPLNVQFTDLSTGGFSALLRDSGKSKNVEKKNSREIISWLWDFNNDGIIDSYNQNPIFTYTQIGVYSVSLTVSDGINEDIEIKLNYITVNPVGSDIELLPINTQLYPNHPNPFNPLTMINFDIKDNESGTLTIFNIKGQIIESHKFESGKHNYLWDASKQASGIYLYKLQTESLTDTKKMILLK